jgi:c-di-GMP-binding flagellar brake protein YcgR
MSSSKAPELNQRVVLRSPEFEGDLTSRVEDVTPTRLLVAIPSDGTNTHDLPVGTQLEIQWISRRGLGRVSGTVAGRQIASVPCLEIDLREDPQVLQRRDAVRVEVNLPVTVWPDDEDAPPTAATSLDLSGGGVRARLEGEWAVGDIVHVRVGLPDEEPIEAAGQIVRMTEDTETGRSFGISFDDMDEPDRERLIRFVFARMRGQAMRGAV